MHTKDHQPQHSTSPK